MKKFFENKPLKIEKYMYEFAQEMGLSHPRQKAKTEKSKKAKGTS